MKEPENPAGPAFEEARGALDAWRRQQISALTAEQRPEYELLRNEADNQIDAKRTEHGRDERQRTIDLARQLINEKPAPGLQPGNRASNSERLKAVRDAVPDIYDGKQSKQAQLYASEARPHLSRAKSQVQEENKQEIAQLQRQHSEKMDAFFRRCEAQRDRQAWKGAVIEAARREAQNSRQHELTRAFNRNSKER